MTIRILLVDDQKLMRIGIKSLFEDYPELEIIAEAQNGTEAIEKAKLLKPDIVLMDIGLPDMSGMDATKKIMELRLPVKAIVGVIQRRKRIIIPNGTTQVMSGDNLIIFTTSENAPVIREFFEEIKWD